MSASESVPRAPTTAESVRDRQVLDRSRPVIELEQLRKVYKSGALEVEALRGVSTSIAEGDYVAITGPSGSGKSTLMHILGCLDTPTSGTYRLAGRDVSQMSETDLARVRNRQIGFVFQQYNLLSSISAARNVELPLTYAGVDRARREAAAMEALERVGIADHAKHRPGEMSGGQQQRVAIARALVTNPDMILCDEPTGALVTAASMELLGLLGELNESGRTVILITHEPEVAAAARHQLRIRDGRLLDDAGPAQGAP